MGLFGKIKENVKGVVERKQAEFEADKKFRDSLKDDIKVERNKAFRKEALVQARKSAKSKARNEYGPQKKSVSSGSAFDGIDVMDFGGMTTHKKKGKKSKRNQDDFFDGIL